MQCSIDGCMRPILCKGLCEVHYARKRRHGDPTVTLIVGTSKGAPRKFLDGLFEDRTDECILWPFARSEAGYAVVGGRSACRVVCKRRHGQPPTRAHQAAHSCGNGHLGCINPEHLSWKTPKDNQADRKSHGTHLEGERVSGAKLTADDVRSIRALYADEQISQSELSRRFGVAQGIISGIISKKRWSHVD